MSEAQEPHILHVLKEAESSTGIHRLGYDADGKLTSIFLSSAIANDDNIRALSAVSEVTCIRVSGSWSGISAEALGELRHLKHLERLELRYANRRVTMDFGMALARITSLRTLTITGSEMDLAAANFLCALPNLTTLQLKSTRDLTDANVVALAQLAQLEELDLSYTGISNASLDVLATLPHLKRLSVFGTKVTEEGVLQSKLAGKVAVQGAKFKTVSNPQDS